MASVFDLLHQQNQENIYPYHILLSDVVANTKPTMLMDFLSRQRKCASPRKYDEYKQTMASYVKMRTKEGDILGLLRGIFTAIHIDNKENY